MRVYEPNILRAEKGEEREKRGKGLVYEKTAKGGDRVGPSEIIGWINFCLLKYVSISLFTIPWFCWGDQLVSNLVFFFFLKGFFGTDPIRVSITQWYRFMAWESIFDNNGISWLFTLPLWSTLWESTMDGNRIMPIYLIPILSLLLCSSTSWIGPICISSPPHTHRGGCC